MHFMENLLNDLNPMFINRAPHYTHADQLVHKVWILMHFHSFVPEPYNIKTKFRNHIDFPWKYFPIPLILKLEIQSSPNKNSFKSLFSYTYYLLPSQLGRTASTWIRKGMDFTTTYNKLLEC
jgi:hypothetical protein